MEKVRSAIGVVVFGLLLSACGGGGGGDGGSGGGTQLPPATPTYSVTTSVTGSGGGSISPSSTTVSQGSTTSFTISAASGSTIAGVSGCGGSLSGTTFTTGPITAACSVTASFEVSSYPVHVVVSGLSGSGLVLQNTGGNNLSIPTNGTFSFSEQVGDGSAYNVTVLTDPSEPWQTCSVTEGNGTVSGGSPPPIAVACVTNQYVVSGTVEGLRGSGLTLTNRGSDSLTISANGPFAFQTTVESGANYLVDVDVLPASPSQSCAVSGGEGLIADSNIDEIVVTCCRRLIGYAGGATPAGIYEIDVETGRAHFLTAVQRFVATGGLAEMNGNWYITNYTSDPGRIPSTTYGLIDLQDGSFTAIGEQGGKGWSGLTADPSQNLLYTVDNTASLVRVTPGTEGVVVGNLTLSGVQLDMRGVALDETDGNLFATTYYEGSPNLYVIDRATAAVQLIGSLGFQAATAGGGVPLAYDQQNRRLYASEAITRSLYWVNTSTGQATQIGTNGVPLGSLNMYLDTACQDF